MGDGFAVGLGLGLAVGLLVFFWFGVVAGESTIKGQVSRGEIACEAFHGKRICWNPKEEER